ncbi:hypothetical protein H0H92_015241 [Tricholoma furcatifolium]|nr:hypothetical protein H0H92_015241 [Tricholoma furcatifolium]
MQELTTAAATVETTDSSGNIMTSTPESSTDFGGAFTQGTGRFTEVKRTRTLTFITRSSTSILTLTYTTDVPIQSSSSSVRGSSGSLTHTQVAASIVGASLGSLAVLSFFLYVCVMRNRRRPTNAPAILEPLIHDPAYRQPLEKSARLAEEARHDNLMQSANPSSTQLQLNLDFGETLHPETLVAMAQEALNARELRVQMQRMSERISELEDQHRLETFSERWLQAAQSAAVPLSRSESFHPMDSFYRKLSLLKCLSLSFLCTPYALILNPPSTPLSLDSPIQITWEASTDDPTTFDLDIDCNDISILGPSAVTANGPNYRDLLNNLRIYHRDGSVLSQVNVSLDIGGIAFSTSSSTIIVATKGNASTVNAVPNTSKSPVLTANTPTGVVVGGAIGGFAAILALVAAVIFLWRRNRAAKKFSQNDDIKVPEEDSEWFGPPPGTKSPGPMEFYGNRESHGSDMEVMEVYTAQHYFQSLQTGHQNVLSIPHRDGFVEYQTPLIDGSPSVSDDPERLVGYDTRKLSTSTIRFLVDAGEATNQTFI